MVKSMFYLAYLVMNPIYTEIWCCTAERTQQVANNTDQQLQLSTSCTAPPRKKRLLCNSCSEPPYCGPFIVATSSSTPLPQYP
jgi:hypothetical protein